MQPFLYYLCITSLAILRVYMLQGLDTSHRGEHHAWDWCQLQESDWGCRCPKAVVSATGGIVGVPVTATGVGIVRPKNQLLGGMSEAVAGLDASGWKRMMGSQPLYLMLADGGQVSVCFPNQVCMGTVFAVKLEAG